MAHANKVHFLPMFGDSSRSKQHSAWAGNIKTWKKRRLSQAQTLDSEFSAYKLPCISKLCIASAKLCFVYHQENRKQLIFNIHYNKPCSNSNL